MKWLVAMMLICSLLKVRDVGESTAKDAVEVRGVGAGAFDPKTWQAGKLNLVRDIRRPMLEPRQGTYRNIYAPSIVQTPSGWAMFYGGWDGVPTPNDRIYRADTSDFIAFKDRRTVIEHGVFQHVCNVSATYANNTWALMCTAYPDTRGLNKPAFFQSNDGESFEPATLDRMVRIDGYDKYADADINGMNVLLREDGKFRLYFNNFKDFGKTYRASSDDGMQFQFEGVAQEKSAMVNDVKKLTVAGESWYLMGLHADSDGLWYALSRDGMKFTAMQPLITNAGNDDRHIVAIGFVVKNSRVLGFLYGAGAAPSLDQNRIFAVWLQKKVVINDAQATALGPDRQVFKTSGRLRGRLMLFAEDGESRIGDAAVDLKPGRAYEITRE